MKICRNDCIFLKPKERDQTANKEPHICRLFNKRVLHNGFKFHPSLVAKENCPFARKIK